MLAACHTKKPEIICNYFLFNQSNTIRKKQGGIYGKKQYFIVGTHPGYRGQRVMLDRDLAIFYGVTTKVFNQAVKRNKERFPEDFMFQVTQVENDSLRSQFVTLKRGQHRKYPPYAFTENGVAMLSSCLRSKSAIQINIQIMRTFTKIRELMSMHRDIYNRMNKLEMKQLSQSKEIININQVIQEMLNLPITLKRKSKPIGFKR